MKRISVSVINIEYRAYENYGLGRKRMLVNGLLRGNYYWFDKNGNLKCMSTYGDGNSHSVEYWIHANGNLDHISTYVNGVGYVTTIGFTKMVI